MESTVEGLQLHNMTNGTELSDGNPSAPGSKEALFKTIKSVFYPMVLTFFFLGMLLASLTMSRKKIRKHPAAIYLYVMLLFDTVYVCSRPLRRAVIITQPGLELSNTTCVALSALQLMGESGDLLITIVLALKRVSMVSNPKRHQHLATQNTAILVSIICVVVATGFAGVNMTGYVWNSETRHCVHQQEYEKDMRRNYSSMFHMALTYSCLALQLTFSVWLGVLLIKKRQNRNLDPIQNSINTARQHSDQLNRINLIVFVTIACTALINIPRNISMSIFWHRLIDDKPRLWQMYFYDSSYLLTVLLISGKILVIGLVSRHIRKECWRAVRCASEKTVLQSHGIEMDPSKFRR